MIRRSISDNIILFSLGAILFPIIGYLEAHAISSTISDLIRLRIKDKI
jgi:hypothetical protein